MTSQTSDSTTQTESIRGSCLCGTCVFEFSGDPGTINKCHCSKCQKVSGTASNAVLWIEPENLRWLKGEASVRTYTMPDGWRSVFCGECGSPLPRLIEDEEWIVPAGVLDADLKVNIRQHIFMDSNPAWEQVGDDAPRYRQGPGEEGSEA